MEIILGCVLIVAVFFGGIAGIAAVEGWVKAERIRAEGQAAQKSGTNVPSDAVLTELKTLATQMTEMQNTSHQFDLSFDAALSRLESRVSRLETKTAATISTETPAAIQNVLNP